MGSTFFQSIRFKFILWYTVFLVIAFSTFSFILYEGFNKFLYNDLDDLIVARAEGVANSINTYWHAKNEEMDHHVSDVKFSDSVACGPDFVKVASRWVEEKTKDHELMSIFVQILNAKGEVILASKAMPRIARIPDDDLADIVAGEDSYDNMDGLSSEGKKRRFRVYSKPVEEDGKVVYIVQTLAPSDLLSLALANLRIILFFLLPLTIILAALPSALLVKMTLRPVDTMINTLRQITAENLKLKIHLPDTKDEIKKLADTFNDMIDRLGRSFSSQQRFIQEISNELKVPMNELREELAGILEKNFSQEESKALIAKASKELEAFSKIIENLLVLTHFENEGVLLEIRRIDFSKLARQVFDQIKIMAENKGITISSDIPENIILNGDENHLKRMLFNLLDNAIKYTYRNGTITLAIQKNHDSITISVSDTGIGVAEDELPYIYDRFYQAGRTRGVKKGFGLGLSTVRSVVEEHNGTIEAVSRIDEGSVFIVTLPLSYRA